MVGDKKVRPQVTIVVGNCQIGLDSPALVADGAHARADAYVTSRNGIAVVSIIFKADARGLVGASF